MDYLLVFIVAVVGTILVERLVWPAFIQPRIDGWRKKHDL